MLEQVNRLWTEPQPHLAPVEGTCHFVWSRTVGSPSALASNSSHRVDQLPAPDWPSSHLHEKPFHKFKQGTSPPQFMWLKKFLGVHELSSSLCFLPLAAVIV